MKHPKLTQPHDTFFKKLFSNEKNVRDFLLSFLPEKLKQSLDLNSIKVIDTEKISKKYKRHHIDLIVECKTREEDKKAQIYILFEHKSYPDKFTLIQILSYMMTIWEKNIENKEELTPIIPFIFYHGKRKFDLAENFSDYFSVKDKNIKEYLLNFKSIIFDTNRIDDKTLTEKIDNLNLLAALLSFKHIFDDIEELKPIFKTLISFGENGLLLFLEYIVISRSVDEEKLKEALKEIGGDKVPTLAQKWFEEGLEEGKYIGWQEGEVEGLKKGLLEAIKIGLQLKFGNNSLTLFESVKAIKDIEKLKLIKDAIIDAKSVDEIEKLLPKD
ncbi:Rpn family recombination-promoting nuclease/putative transposase [Hippea alviniae]|uniref:Rpn family recombination-promoting nuclease/putative transposase n=1 Tax=Hippea alviniae TaxID=1279027 RepID=UPI0003B5CE19|nr:Rpn family recombination-promoting nuclease/putative transposase [Hippea alviniae]